MGLNKKDAVLQVVGLQNSVFSTAGSYPGGPDDGAYVYVNVVQHETVVFKFSVGPGGEPIFTQVAQTPEKTAFVLGVGHGTSTSLNGQPGTGLYWVADIQGLNLRIYKAVPNGPNLELVKGLNIPGQMKFSRPSFGDGRAYLTTSDGFLVMVGSPVNPPLLCTSPVQFGEATLGNAIGIEMTVSCKANIATTITGVALRLGVDFSINSVPTLPMNVPVGSNITFKAVFKPTAPGPLSDDVVIKTTNGVANFADSTPVALRGIGRSSIPILFISPNTVTFPGIITGENPDGILRSFVMYNQGDTDLTITDYFLSKVSENGPWEPSNAVAGPFTLIGLPTTIPARGYITVQVNFNPTANGNYGAYLKVVSDGGTKFLTIAGTAGGYAKALLEFEKPDGSGWVTFDKDDPNFVFDFGTVFQQQTRNLKMRLTNAAPADGSILTVTVSKPPTGGTVVGARNGIDLGEGTQLAPGQSAVAVLFCSVPKSQINVDPYVATAGWTMNLGDPLWGKHNIRFQCEAVAEQGGPLESDGQARYRYLGCYKENNPGRQLENQLYGSDTLKNEKCIADCFAQPTKYIFAGTQYHRECWCGNTIPKLKVGDENCNFDCTGNGTQICGGNGYFGGGSYISLFADKERYNNGGPSGTATGTGTATSTLASTSTSAAPTPSQNPGNDVFEYAGCYAEPPGGGRALSFLTPNDLLTASMCFAQCPRSKYVGLEYGRECWCGDTLNPLVVKKPDTDCNMLCKGNPLEYCGAGSRLSLYTKKVAGSSSTIATSSTVISSSTTPPDSTVSTSTTTTTSTSATPTPTGPAINPGNDVFGYAGCYAEPPGGGRALSTLYANDLLTANMCFAQCPSSNYVGLEYGRECWCGNTLNIAVVKKPDTECSMLCKGNALEYCGAGSRLNIYTKKVASSTVTSSTAVSSSSSTTHTDSSSVTTTSTSATPTPTGPSIDPGTAGYSHIGCYTEATAGRALPNKLLDTQTMTVPICIAFCALDNYKYAGVEYGSECWCGNALAAGAVLAPMQTDCSMLCKGDSLHYCGAENRLNIYQQDASSSSSTTSSTVAPTTTITTVITSTVATVTSTSTTLTTVTSTTATCSGPPSSSTSPAPWAYLGCYNETATGRALSGANTVSADMTVDKCKAFCLTNNLPLAGLEYAYECYCGSGLPSDSIPGQSGCIMSCAGDATQTCGGGSRLSVYNYTMYLPPQTVDAVGEYKSQGCWTEGTGGRALTKYGFANNTGMTVELCVGACELRGWKWAGVEYAQECYCGDAIMNGAKKADNQGNCNMLCKGNKREFCGAGSRLNVYWANGTVV